MQQPAAEPGFGFERMTESVAEIEERPVALLALVGGDDSGLHPAAGHDRWPQRLRFERQQRIALALAPGEEFSVLDQTVFDGLGIAGEQLATRQARQASRIGEHQAWLVKGADQILARRAC